MVAYKKTKICNGAINKSYSDQQPKNENENNCLAFFANKREKTEEKGAMPKPDEEFMVEAHTKQYNQKHTKQYHQNHCFL